MGTPPRHRPRRLAAAPLAGLAALSLLFTFTVADTHAAARSPLANESGGRLAVAELQGAHTILWSVDTADPRRRTVLGDVPHANGWGVKAQTSPDGRYLAYLTFPAAGLDPTADGELWVVDTDTTASRRLGTHLDAMATPRWSPDGAQVVARQIDSASATFQLLAFGADVTDGQPQVLAREPGVDWAGAVGWRHGRFTYATIDNSGTWLKTAGDDPLRLTPGIARDVALSPDGSRLVFAEVPGPQATGLSVAVADLGSRTVGSIPAGAGAFAPVWAPNGGVTMGGAAPAYGLMGAAVTVDMNGATSLLRPSPGRVLAPVAWNPNGGQLAARLLPANSQPGNDELAVVDGATGMPRPLPFTGYVSFAGWLQ